MTKPDLSYSQVVTSATCTIVTARALSLTQEANPPVGSFAVPGSTDLLVLGDAVTIRGRIRAPGKKIHILTRVLNLAPVSTPSGREGAEVNVDGEGGDPPDPKRATPDEAKKGDPGICIGIAPPSPGRHIEVRGGGNGTPGDDGVEGAPGKPGRDAGEVVIMCERFSRDQGLTLSARGGRGGDGQDGQNGGKGGDGGDGADGEEGVGWGSMGYKMQSGGGNGAQGGSGGKGGQGGNGGNGGRVVFRAVNPDNFPADKIVCFADRGVKGKPGQGGLAGMGGALGRVGKAPSARTQVQGAADGQRGIKGAREEIPGDAGADGKGGAVERRVGAEYEAIKAALQSAFQ